jgi:hypothetical protein
MLSSAAVGHKRQLARCRSVFGLQASGARDIRLSKASDLGPTSESQRSRRHARGEQQGRKRVAEACIAPALSEEIMDNSVFQARWLLIPIASMVIGFVLLGVAAT